MKRVASSQLRVGVPLPFSVFDEDHNLLLGKGATLSNERQLERLVERGLYVDELSPASPGHSPQEPARLPAVAESANSVEQLRRIRAELNTLLSGKPVEPAGFYGKLLALSTRLQNACQKDPDACLAAMLLERASRYSVRHMVHVAVVSQIVGEGAGIDASGRFSMISAALTMNLSMLDMQDHLQAMQTGELTAAQRDAIRSHPEASARMLEELGVDDALCLELVRAHHEAVDGTGYPRGLSGAAVPLPAQILSLADGYTARLERRPDRDGKMPNLSLRDIFLSRGKAVDPLLAALLVKKVGIYPPGLVVELGNGEIAVVTHRSDNANAPEVHSLLSPERTLYSRPVRRATDREPFAIKHPVPLEAVRVRFNPLQFWANA